MIRQATVLITLFFAVAVQAKEIRITGSLDPNLNVSAELVLEPSNPLCHSNLTQVIPAEVKTSRGNYELHFHWTRDFCLFNQGTGSLRISGANGSTTIQFLFDQLPAGYTELHSIAQFNCGWDFDSQAFLCVAIGSNEGMIIGERYSMLPRGKALYSLDLIGQVP